MGTWSQRAEYMPNVTGTGAQNWQNLRVPHALQVIAQQVSRLLVEYGADTDLFPSPPERNTFSFHVENDGHRTYCNFAVPDTSVKSPCESLDVARTSNQYSKGRQHV